MGHKHKTHGHLCTLSRLNIDYKCFKILKYLQQLSLPAYFKTPRKVSICTMTKEDNNYKSHYMNMNAANPEGMVL